MYGSVTQTVESCEEEDALHVTLFCAVHSLRVTTIIWKEHLTKHNWDIMQRNTLYPRFVLLDNETSIVSVLQF